MSILIPTPAIDFPPELPCWSPELDFPGSSFEWLVGELAAMAPPPDMSVSECADRHRVLQQGVARKPGPWVTDFTPYLREVMDAYKLEHVRIIDLQFATQLGKTETLYNILLYIIAFDPYPTILMYPREDDAKGVSRTRVQPMIEDCAILREKKPARNDLYQLLEMHFPAMVLYLVGANSLAALAQKPAKNILRDEINKYPKQLGTDADPMSKSAERAKSFWDIRKEINVSSCTVAGVGISASIAEAQQVFTLHLPCPHCERPQDVDFYTQIRTEVDGKEYGFDEKATFADYPADKDFAVHAKKNAYCICAHCGTAITNDARPWMIANYSYVPDRMIDYEPDHIGFKASTFASPWMGWGDFIVQYLGGLQARDEKGDTGPLMTFVNDWLNREWKDAVIESTAARMLENKGELDWLICPADTVAITCGIDVQKHGFWEATFAWNTRMESSLISREFLAEWDDVEHHLFETLFEVEGSDHAMQIWRCGMDIGGGKDSGWGEDWTKTEEIITWIRENGRGVVFPVKGMARPSGQKVKQSVMDKMPGAKGGIIPGGLIRWDIDTDQMKDTIHWRMSNEQHTQRITLPSSIEQDDQYIYQFLAEEKQRQRHGQYTWVRVRKDNHLLDCTVYGHAVADFQCMGGVRKLAAPLYAKPAQPRPQPQPRREQHTNERSSVRGYKRPDWLRNRRR